MSAPRDDAVFVNHILDAADRVDSYVQGMDYAAFATNRVVQDALIRQGEVIGEAAKRLSPAFTAARSAIPWKQIRGMRDVLIHNYFDVAIDRVWKTATEDVPALREVLRGDDTRAAT